MVSWPRVAIRTEISLSRDLRQPCQYRLAPMCYRFTLARSDAIEALCRELGLDVPAFFPRYNVGLTQRAPVVKAGPKAEMAEMAFGFTLPARDPGGKPMVLGNARAETLLDKPAFRDAARHRRCLVPADGFYEWEKSGSARLPHYFFLRERRPFFFAGLWQPESAAGPAAFALVTTAPNSLLQPVHDRMPVILGPNSGPAWLGGEPLAPARFAQLCRPLPAEMMGSHRVDPRVNRATYEAPDCIAPL
jgi:putative SOS response-associated peptidase YedK